MMNDPFDSRSILHEQHSIKYVKAKSDFERSFEPNFTKSLYDKIFRSDNWFDELMRYIVI